MFPAEVWALQAGPSDIFLGPQRLIFSPRKLGNMTTPGGSPQPNDCVQVPPRDKVCLQMVLRANPV